jgi:hypothetical protein
MDGVNAARGEQDETGAVALAVFEEVDGAVEVVVNEIAGRRAAVHTGEDARVGGGDDEVGGGERVDLGSEAEVGGDDADAESKERVAVGLAAGADVIIEADDLVAGRVKSSRQSRAYEAVDS